MYTLEWGLHVTQSHTFCMQPRCTGAEIFNRTRKHQLSSKRTKKVLKYFVANILWENLPAGFSCHIRVHTHQYIQQYIQARGLLPASYLCSMWNLSNWVSNLWASTSQTLVKESTTFSLAQLVCCSSHPLNYCYLRINPHKNSCWVIKKGLWRGDLRINFLSILPHPHNMMQQKYSWPLKLVRCKKAY